MAAYYNENDPFAAAWLRELVKGGHVAGGEVDERSIVEVEAADLAGFTQCHFFAGIATWSHALRLAAWDDARPVWTGSCPCQPFSAAGQGAGVDDHRHLWPEFFRLVKECRPAVVLGEQVASKAGREWWDAVQADLEGEDYACAVADLCAHSVGAPHIRQRLWWVGVAASGGRQRLRPQPAYVQPVPTGALVGGLADASHQGEGGRRVLGPGQGDGAGLGAARQRLAGLRPDGDTCTADGFWRDVDWLYCRDGKWRPVGPGTFPLVDGAAARVGRLRGYGNAIVAPLARTFIETVMEIT